MVEWWVRGAWGVLALVHLLPALALIRPAMIERLYGVDSTAPSFLLLQHRAALFAVIVLLCLWAMLVPDVRRLATVAVAISMVSFLWLYAKAGMPAALASIARADLIALPALALVAWRAFIAG